MPGALLSGVLPFIYSQGDRLKNKLSQVLADPIGVAQQAAGQIQDSAREQSALMAAAFADPQRPFLPTDSNALAQAVQNVQAGPLGFAPAGMTAQALRPALMMDDGSVIAGEPGRTHLSILATSPQNLAGKVKDSGFVGADGKYLTRDEAEAIANLGAGPLDAAQYARSAR